MTSLDAVNINKLQLQGYGYRKIAAALELPVYTVKSYCQRHPVRVVEEKPEEGNCRECGATLEQMQGKRKREFCSNQCRQRWWNKNKDKLTRKTYHTNICPWCETEFSIYGRPMQIFCSRACYDRARRKVVEG